MRKIIFYSWQSDLPNSLNRGLIQKALEKVATEIESDTSVSIEPVIDRDTQGISGAPDIVSTIFEKIDKSDIFVADVSIINSSMDCRSTPNPNVLIELGYALKSLGFNSVILVFNTAFGKIEKLPFDLKMRRVITFDAPEDCNRSEVRKKLVKQFNGAFRATFVNKKHKLSELNLLMNALEEQKPNRIIQIRQYLSYILEIINSVAPKKHSDGGTVEDLSNSIDNSLDIVSEYLRIVDLISAIGDERCIREIYRWLGNIFVNYNNALEYSGRISNADHDYFKFLGHELLVSLFGILLREKKWDIIQLLMDIPIPLDYVSEERGPGNVYWYYASQHLPSLFDESARKRRVSIHADKLNTRHSTGLIGELSPMKDFVEADYFLFLYGEIVPNKNQFSYFLWRPWSSLYLKDSPMFIKDAEHNSTASHIKAIFKLSDIEELKHKLLEKYSLVTRLYKNSRSYLRIRDEDIKRIGSRL